jgi:deoxyribodipyrimidine photolyase-related protein
MVSDKANSNDSYMPKNITLILGDQLFKNHPAFEIKTDYALIESKDFNSDYKYHKSRLYHCFVAMREYIDYLHSLDKSVHYFWADMQYTLSMMFDKLAGIEYEYTDVYIAEVDDKGFKKLIIDLCATYKLKLHWLPSPKFLNNHTNWLEYKKQYPKRLFMNDFYIMQRKRLGLYVDKANNSTFGKWSLDEDNRNKIPKTETVKSRLEFYESHHTLEVAKVIDKYFGDNPCGYDKLYFPVNHKQAFDHLEQFGSEYFTNFGRYEDAISNRDPFLFHSTISPLLNNGLLTPQEVIDWVLEQKNIPDNSVEGFIRQIIGWREWVNQLYWNVYEEDISKYNFFEHHKPLPDYFWDQKKLVEIKDNTPLYNALNNVFDYAYCHHIERLMVISNWMVLNEYDPKECYNWFMTMFIDSYNWVMVANVMGMGLFADGGIFATKPYVSGGNYLKKMSDYTDHKNWEPLWTDLFWKFLMKHETFFRTNPRLAMLITGHKNRTTK